MKVSKNIMPYGVSVLASTPEPEKYLNDNIHPCVRYIADGFAGHKWWMTTTPYPNYNARVENPILYYGDSETDGVPPASWQGGVVVEDTPSDGYNSDDNLYFDGTRLWVFWRENNTPDCLAHNTTRATFGRYTLDGETFSEKKFFAPLGFNEVGKTGDCEMCPCVRMVGNTLIMYGTYYEFSPVKRDYGLSIWHIDNNDLINETFELVRNVGILTPKGFDFWHFDMFEYNGVYYCVATEENATKILLGKSADGINFTFYATPLISTEETYLSYLYKPTALVVNHILYLWHPAKINGYCQIYMTSKPMADVLSELENSISIIS